MKNGNSKSAPELSPGHEAMIEASAIAPEVVSARGYTTVTIKARLRELGFSDRQCRVPALLVPIWNAFGEIASYQIRPDRPRVVSGKAIKYETPKGSGMVLDVPPMARRWLGDPNRPLFVTEGARKADAGVSVGLCTIGLLGVWNWRGTNDRAGKTALPDWEAIALNGRDVYIVFDSDVMTKSPVHMALCRLKGFVESRGAEVRVVYLPAGEGATKVGLDDYLAGGHGVDDLLAHATDELRQPEGEGSRPTPYSEIEGGGIIYHKPTGHDGDTVPVPLANFTAHIISDVVNDDGAETRRTYGIVARLGGHKTSFDVAAERFASLNWINEHLGPKAIIEPGQSLRDHLRAAIQKLSPDEIAERRVYGHTGWRKIGDSNVYLHAGGAIGKEGAVEGVEVHLDPPLDRFHLPAPSEGNGLRVAVRECLKLFEGLVPDQVAFPMFSAPWRAVLGGNTFSIHIVGTTGVCKTEVAALLQRHFGPEMDAEHLPGSWSSTANSLEALAFLTKDSALVVDDFAPKGSPHDVKRIHSSADRLIRAQGNRLGRRRMRADGSLRPDRPPRGLLISTGEDVPSGHSIRARLVIIDIRKGDVELDQLTERQAAAPAFSIAMAGFLRWLAPQMEGVPKVMRDEVDRERDVLLSRVAHARTATAGANLLFGFGMLMKFAVEIGAIDEGARSCLEERARAAFIDALDAQADHQEDADVAQFFMKLVADSLQSGSSHLADLNKGNTPTRADEVDEDAARLVGWRFVESEDELGRHRSEWRPGGRCIGYVDVDGGIACLIPRAAYKAAQEMAQHSPMGISIGPKMLTKALDEAGLIVSRDSDRRTKKTRAGGRSLSLLHLRMPDLLSIPVPDNPSGSTGTGTDPGKKTALGASLGGAVPRVPDVPVHREQEALSVRGARAFLRPDTGGRVETEGNTRAPASRGPTVPVGTGTSGTTGTTRSRDAGKPASTSDSVPVSARQHEETGTENGNMAQGAPSSAPLVRALPNNGDGLGLEADKDTREELAPILEYDANLPRRETERQAGLFQHDLADHSFNH